MDVTAFCLWPYLGPVHPWASQLLVESPFVGWPLVVVVRRVPPWVAPAPVSQDGQPALPASFPDRDLLAAVAFAAEQEPPVLPGDQLARPVSSPDRGLHAPSEQEPEPVEQVFPLIGQICRSTSPRFHSRVHPSP